ncbi:hypothetical protein [Streptomyces acidiscabies]|uniref:Uncharacterized protein n=1 Tax=Streptomyces acidiscabies TaxID=42234 RepID=A0AAP6B5K1_9ACTN|nr:hypothetical protein [Streptomyces acidiscabies]MBP5941695.1 hypothetical protein [Streptomyces sp. LBUM 1476]MBZ3913102.1 hypothetical protein [Streptomyces acidiscabies]MDX2958589.1 hypothetical protein [Streptomyces acidiscabies]MDX3020905.1 hypothetical protein [Streptomyces acidiscabies]MDX3790066.1 hypothetical protein [Streptomyces acidiscabies]
MTSTDSLAGLGRPTVAEAASELTRACQAAGLKIQVSSSPSKAGFGRYLVLGEVTPQTAVRLAELIEEQLTEAHQAAEELWNTFQACGLTTPTPYVVGSRIDLGDVSVETAEQLAVLLGAPPRPDSSAPVVDWVVGQEAADRPASAFAEVTGGGLLDAYFHPDCLRCDEGSAVSLKSVSVEHAQLLGEALQFGVPS